MPTLLNVPSRPNLESSGSRAVSRAFVRAYFAPPESHTPAKRRKAIPDGIEAALKAAA